MSIIDRLLGRKQRRLTQRNMLLWPSWQNDQPQWQLVDQESFIREGYNLNAVIYSCITYKARVSKGVPLRAYTGTRDEPELLPADHPLTRLVDRPNPWQSWPEFQELNEVYYNLFGNCYVVIIRDREQQPTMLYTFRPDWVYHIYEGRNSIKGYAYVPGGTDRREALPILAQDMLHIKLPNPGDPYVGLGKGLSPIYSLSQSGDVDNSATAFLKMFFDHGTMPQGVLTTDQPINTTTSDMIRERWNATYGNWRNWVDIAVLGHGASYQRIGANFDELDMQSLDARNAGRIAAPFGVPLTLIFSQPELVQATYSNKQTDREIFWEDTMLPELRGFEVEYQYGLRGDNGEFVAFDYGDIPALQRTRMEHAAQVGDAWERGAATMNDYRSALGLDPVERGDVFKLPITAQLIPVERQPELEVLPAAPAQDDETGAVAATDEEETEGREMMALPAPIPLYKAYGAKPLTLEQKLAHYKQFDRIAESWEATAEDEAAKQLRRDKRNILAIIRDAQQKAIQQKANVVWQDALIKVLDYLTNDSQESWRKGWLPVFNGVILDQGNAMNTEFGIQFDVRNLLAEEWYRDYTMTFAQEITETTHNTMQDIFSNALAEGWSIDEMSDQLETLFDQWITGNVTDAQRERFALDRLPNWRRRLIARDQTLRASNAGAHNLHKAWGVEFKEWLATPDQDTRDTHRIGASFGDPYVVKISDPFVVGGCNLMYPGDPGAGCLGQTIQCRCQSLPVFLEDL